VPHSIGEKNVKLSRREGGDPSEKFTLPSANILSKPLDMFFCYKFLFSTMRSKITPKTIAMIL
jgi:hypothetical protein